MKIHIQSGKQNICLRFPTMLIFNRPVAWLCKHFGFQYVGSGMENISPEAIDSLFAEFRRIKKKYGSWELVNVESSDGSKVLIVL